MKKQIMPAVVMAFVMIVLPAAVIAEEQSTDSEYAWVLSEIVDHENSDDWVVSDAHDSYIVTHGYSQGSYSASTTYEGDDPYKEGLSGTLAVQANFSGIPEIIYPDQPVSLKLSFAATENSVVKLSFSAAASADFDQWDVGPGGKTGGAIEFVNSDNEHIFYVTSANSESYDEILTAGLGAGRENSRIALRLKLFMGVSMGTNYVYEWKPVGDAPAESTGETSAGAATPTPVPSPVPEVKVIRLDVPPPDDPEWETFTTELVKFGDLWGEVNVKRYGEDDDAYIFAELDTPLHHGLVIKTHSRSGAILSFSDMSTFVVKENTIIVLDIKQEKESKIGLVAGTVWTNLKKMVTGGSLEVEMSQAVAGIKGTILAASVTDDGEVFYLFTSSADITSKESGETVTLKPGQKARVDFTGALEVSSFDIEKQAEVFEISMADLEADGYQKNNNSWLMPLLLILAAVIAGAVAALILYRNRKTRMTAQSPAGIAGPYGQTMPPAAPQTRFCPNCGQPISGNDHFCQHCGHDVSNS